MWKLCIFIFCTIQLCLGLPSLSQVPTNQVLKSYMESSCAQKYLLHLTDVPEVDSPNFRELTNGNVMISVGNVFSKGPGDIYFTLDILQITSEGTYPINLSLEYPNGTFYDFGPVLEQECVSPPSTLTIKPFDDKLKIPRVYPENNMMVYSIVIENIDRALNIAPYEIDCGLGVYYCEIYGSSVWNQFDIFVDLKAAIVPKDVVTPITATLKGNVAYQFTIPPPLNSSFVTPTTVQTQTLTAAMAKYLPNYYSINTESAPLQEFSFIGFSSSARSTLSDLNSMVFYQDSTKKCSLHWNHLFRDRGLNFQGFSINNNQLVSSFPDPIEYVAYDSPKNYLSNTNAQLSLITTYNIFTIELYNLYNPKMNYVIGQGFGPYSEFKNNKYPMGFLGQNGKRFTFRFSFLVSKYYKGESGNLFYAGFGGLTSSTLSGQADSLTPDVIAPVIVDLKYAPLENGMIHIVCKVTDNLSGVVNIYFYDLSDNVITFMTLQNLVSGVSTDGSFEIVVNPLIYSTVTRVMIQDAAGNMDIFYSSDIYTLPNIPGWFGYAKLLDQIQPLFNDQYIGVSNINQITNLQFSENNLNLLQPKTIVMSLNFTDSHPLITPYIKFAFSKAPSYSANTFYGKWDKVKKYYQIEIIVPSQLPSGAIDYTLFVPRDGNFTNAQLAQQFDDSVNLYINSPISYQFPPVVDSFNVPATTSVPVGSITQIPMEFTISSYGDFVNGTLRIVGELDVKGYEYNFTKSNLDVNSKITLQLSIDGDRCVNQVYQITYLHLVDSNGYYSETNFDGNTVDSIDPFLKVYSQNRNMTINCATPNTNQVNTMTNNNLYKSKSTVNVGSLDDNDRTIVFDMYYTVTTSTDVLRDEYNPYIFLTTPRFDVLSVETTLVQKFPNNTVHRTASITLPIGYAYPDSITLSIYGIADISYRHWAFSTSDLYTKVPIIQTTYTMNKPFLNGTSTISSNGGVLSLYGFRFGSQPTTRVQYKYVDDNAAWVINTEPYTYFSGLVLALPFPPSMTPFYVQVQVDMELTNEILVTPYEGTSSSSSDIASSSAASSSDIASSSSASSNDIASSSTIQNSSSQKESSSSSIDKSSSSSSPPKNNSQGGNGLCFGTPLCGGPNKGKCVDPLKGCQCIYPYTGIDCTSQIIIIPQPPVNPINPNSSLDFNTTLPDGKNIKYSSLISVVALREYNENTIIKEYNFDEWILSNTSNTEFIYSTQINENTQTPTYVNVTIKWFENEQNITFANEVLNMKPSSMKYTVNISEYSFASSVNYLQLVMYASIQSDDSDNMICSSKQYYSSNIEESEFEYISLQVDDHSLVGRFIKRGIVDGRIGYTNNVFLDSEKKPTSISSSQAYIGINIPYYSKNVFLDPDFSVLLDNKPASDNDIDLKTCQPKKSSLTGAQIAGIAIGSVGFAAVIGVSTTYLLVKKRQKNRMLKDFHNSFGSKAENDRL